jgi:hypothetical protein
MLPIGLNEGEPGDAFAGESLGVGRWALGVRKRHERRFRLRPEHVVDPTLA